MRNQRDREMFPITLIKDFIAVKYIKQFYQFFPFVKMHDIEFFRPCYFFWMSSKIFIKNIKSKFVGTGGKNILIFPRLTGCLK